MTLYPRFRRDCCRFTCADCRFERETARSMVCHSLVNFSIIEDEIRSAPIRPGEFASFCELKPGRYRYKVVRPNADISSALGSSGRLDGVIIVDEVKAGDS